MNTDLTSPEVDSAIALRRDEALAAARRYAKKSRSESTWRTYESAWRQFDEWCLTVALPSLPAEPETVAMFIAAQADEGKAVATLEHRLAAIRLMHLGQGIPSPHNTLAVVEVMRGLRRQRARVGQQSKKKAPATDEIIKRVVDNLDLDTLRGKRDRAIFLYGFAGALRRAELVAIDLSNIEIHERGHLLSIPFSKGDQVGKGQIIPILAQPESLYCPVNALKTWIHSAKIKQGAVFRRFYKNDKLSHYRLGDRAVAEFIKSAIYQLKDPALNYQEYSGHSLRRGLLTSAGKNGVDLLKLIAQSRHTQIDTVLGYVENQEPFENHVASRLLQSNIRQGEHDH